MGRASNANCSRYSCASIPRVSVQSLSVAVLKQVVCMFFSVNGPRFRTKQTDLVKFVLDKESKSFPNNVRVYAFYTLPTGAEQQG